MGTLHASHHDLAAAGTRDAAGAWSHSLSDSVRHALEQQGCTVELLDACTVRLAAVPMGRSITKTRSSVWLQLVNAGAPHLGCVVFVDGDLACSDKASPSVQRAFDGEHAPGRGLKLNHLPYHGNVNEVLIQFLDLVHSPLWVDVHTALVLDYAHPTNHDVAFTAHP